MKKIIAIVFIIVFTISCKKDDDGEKYYNLHDIVLPTGINKDEYILAFQLEAIFSQTKQNDYGIGCLPHPIQTKSDLVFNFSKNYNDLKIQVESQKTPEKKVIFEGNVNAGGRNFNISMNELFNQSYGFYTVKFIHEHNTISEREIFYTNGYYVYEDKTNNRNYFNTRFIDLKETNINKIQFVSDFGSYFDKNIDRNLSNATYLGNYTLSNQIRLAIVKPNQNTYIEEYVKVISYSDMKKLKEIIFKESDKIEN